MTDSSDSDLLTPELRELAVMSTAAMARRFGISETTASRRRALLLAPTYEETKDRRAHASRQRHEAHLAVRRAVRRGCKGSTRCL